LVVFQLQLEKRLDSLPLTRDYIAPAELRLARNEAVLAGRRIAGA
jgi:hypothetical protein